MDVILLKDVPPIGKEGAVVRVKPGFARNYLVPRGLAVPASAQELKAAQERARQTQRKHDLLRQHAEALKQKVEALSLTFKLTLGEGDKPFGSVTVNEIVHALAQHALTIEKHAIQLAEPIKSLGMMDVPVKLHPDVTATLKLGVVKAQ